MKKANAEWRGEKRFRRGRILDPLYGHSSYFAEIFSDACVFSPFS